MAFNYKLIGQVKQAMYKLAAPPAEVTEGKPYVKPPELEPQQPKILSPNELIISGAKRYEDALKKTEKAMAPVNMEGVKRPQKPQNYISDPVEFRIQHKIPPEADLSAYPEVQKEWLKRWAEKEKYNHADAWFNAGGDIKKIQERLDASVINFAGTPMNYDYYKWNAHHAPDAKFLQNNLREDQIERQKTMERFQHLMPGYRAKFNVN